MYDYLVVNFIFYVVIHSFIIGNQVRTFLISLIFIIPTQLFAQEPNTNSEETNSEENIKQEIKQDIKSPSIPFTPVINIPQNCLEVQVTLMNGIIIQSYVDINDALNWSNGESLIIKPQGQEQIQITGTQIASLQQAQIIEDVDVDVNIPANHVPLSVHLSNDLIIKGYVSIEETITWKPGTPLTFTPLGLDPIQIEAEKIKNLFQKSHQEQLPDSPIPRTLQSNIAVETTTDSNLVPLIPYKSPEGFIYPNPAASRYIYAPSSIPMKKGQGYISQKLLVTASAYALNDNFTILMGTFTFFPPLLTVLGGKWGYQINENIHIGAGSEFFIIPEDGELTASIGFGSITYGNHDRHFSFATGLMGGPSITNDFLISQGPSIPLVLSGHNRISDRLALVTENWLILNINSMTTLPDGPNPILATANSFVFRILGTRDVKPRKRANLLTTEGYPRTTWDIGIIALSYRDMNTIEHGSNTYYSEFVGYEFIGPFPWVDFAWHFGPSGH